MLFAPTLRSIDKLTSLRDKSLTAVIWSGIETFARTGLSFVISIVLARLLLPEEFGTVALLYVFTGIAWAFVNSGFSAALIQRQDTTLKDESTVYWFSMGMASLMATLLWFSASAIAEFFEKPILVPLTGVFALNLMIGALGSVHGSLLSKRLDFKTQAKISVISSMVSGIVAIVMAWQGFGVWALASQVLVASIVSVALLWWMSSWRPAFVFSLESAKRLFSFGGYLFVAGLLDVAYTRGYALLIGKVYGAKDVGFYNRADSLQQLPAGLLMGVLSRVAFPVFSSVGQDKEKLHQGMRMTIRAVMLINAPVMLGLMVVGDSLIPLLFGDNWSPAIPIFQVLCIGGLFWPLHVINLNVLMAQGYSNLFFRLEVIKKIIGISLLVTGSFFGVMGIAWGTVVFGGIAFIINAHYSAKFLGYGALHQAFDFLPALLVALFMAIVVSILKSFLTWPNLPALAMLVVTGIVVFIGFSLLVKLSALSDSIALIREYRKGRRSSLLPHGSL